MHGPSTRQPKLIPACLKHMSVLHLCIHTSLLYTFIYVCFRVSRWGGLLWHLWKCRWHKRGQYFRERRAAQTSGQRPSAGGEKGAHHYQALLSEEQKGAWILFTFTPISIPAAYSVLFTVSVHYLKTMCILLFVWLGFISEQKRHLKYCPVNIFCYITNKHFPSGNS